MLTSLPLPIAAKSRVSTSPLSRGQRICPIDPALHGAALARLYSIEFGARTTSHSATLSKHIHAKDRELDFLCDTGKSGFVCQLSNGDVIGGVTLLVHPYINDTVLIANLVVDSRFRQRGIGRQLMRHAIAFCNKNDVSHVELQVDADNGAAIDLYSSLGLVKIGEVARYHLQNRIALPICKTREAIHDDAKEIQRLVAINVPVGMALAEAISSQRYAIDCGEQRMGRCQWFAMDGAQGRLLGAVHIEALDAKQMQIELLLDPRTTKNAGLGLIRSALNTPNLLKCEDIRARQSQRGMMASRAIEAAGFVKDRCLAHMRLNLRSPITPAALR